MNKIQWSRKPDKNFSSQYDWEQTLKQLIINSVDKSSEDNIIIKCSNGDVRDFIEQLDTGLETYIDENYSIINFSLMQFCITVFNNTKKETLMNVDILDFEGYVLYY